MQPLARADGSDLLVTTRAKNAAKLPLNIESFRNLQREEVDADEVFFHKYFNSLGKKGKKDKKKEKNKDKDTDGESGSECEEEIWKALVGSRPNIEAEGSDLDDEDLDMDDLESNSDADDADDAAGSPSSEKEGRSGAVDGEDDEMADFSDGGVDIDFGEEEEDAIFGSDDEVDLDEAFLKEAQTVESETPKERGKKSKENEKESKKRRKRKLKNLPTFASVEEYEKLLGGEDDEGF